MIIWAPLRTRYLHRDGQPCADWAHLSLLIIGWAFWGGVSIGVKSLPVYYFQKFWSNVTLIQYFGLSYSIVQIALWQYLQ